MKKLQSALTVAFLIFGVSAAAASDPGFSGNTVHITGSSGDTLSYAMTAEGTFTSTDGSSGTWDYDGETLCYRVEGLEGLCGAMDGSKQPGESWEQPSWGGEDTLQVSISEGL